jgi:preprotein translocase subunit SecA
MLKKFVKIFGGDPNKREIDRYNPVIHQVNSLEAAFEELSQDELCAKTEEFKGRLENGETLDDILTEAFAAVREASKRTLGLRHYDVQLIGGMALHQSKIAEMRTGEGKTLVATLPMYLNALTGRGVHLITVNDYLARRDARWMAPIYDALGLKVGVLQMAARTENGKKAFVVDLKSESPHEDQHQLRMVNRREAYAADIIYGTNSEFGFDYLRDNMTMTLEERVQRGHYYAIIDEADNVLIDEARTPLIISGPAQEDTEWYIRLDQVVKRLRPEDYEIVERDRTITLTEMGEAHVEELLDMSLRDPDRPEDLTPEQERILGYLEQALRAQYLFKRNKDYLVQGGKVVIIDEFTGRLMPGRRWSDGLHQAVEAKEGVRVQAENVTYATITIQNYFRMYEKLAGMTGTALTEAEEFHKIYNLDVLAIPTNLEYQAFLPESSLIELDDRDEQGYRYNYYADKNDQERKPVYWRRKDYPDVIFLSEEAKFRAIVQEILRYHVQGRPLLVGTTSVDLSERLSNRLRAEPLRRLAQVLLIRDAWFEKNNREEDGRQVDELEPLNQPLDRLQVPDLRKMASSLGLSMNPEDPENLDQLLSIMRLEKSDQERLVNSLKGGIPAEVLNARKHTEESQIIAGAGAFGAVTIATNMAGRGVDIKLGGELAEEVMVIINRVLHRAGYEDPYNMQMEERRQSLQSMPHDDYGIYESEVNYLLQHMQDMESVKRLGGLHVIGSERHEARRIDNQLRGRAARQGDPGSSRFYLSLEDDLMRRFGGQQANDMMQRLRVDEAMPIEMGLVGRLVEQSQTRVEGANFDVRKHLLEYDDVLNTQRTKIYAQRNRIFLKEDLSEDVTEMLRTEVAERVPKALKNDEGPWTLLAWLEQVQPSFTYNGHIVPSYTLRLLVDDVRSHMLDGKGREAELAALVEVARGSLQAEKEHLLQAVSTMLDQFLERLESQMAERLEAVDAFFEGLSLADETDVRAPRELAEELEGLARMPLRLTGEQQRSLRENPHELAEAVREQVEAAVSSQMFARLVGAIERRVGEPLEVSSGEFTLSNWETFADAVYEATASLMDRRQERLVGSDSDGGAPGGIIAKDLEAALAREKDPLTHRDKELLKSEVRSAFDSGDGSAGKTERDRVLESLSTGLARIEGALGEDERDGLVERVATSLADDGAGEAILSELEAGIDEAEEIAQENRLIRMLMLMPVGSQTSFDRKTHRRVQTRTIRFTYSYFAARLLENVPPEEISEDVLAHLEQAQESMRKAWGRMEWKRLSSRSSVELDAQVRRGLQAALGAEFLSSIQEQPLAQLDQSSKARVIDELGRQSLTEVYRQLLLGVITELWVEYLTQMEALRVSIGLEAYGQRDPLVQYKSKAFELFKNLLSNMRLGVITRMFTYRPRDLSGLQLAARRTKEDGDGGSQELPETTAQEPEIEPEQDGGETAGDGKETQLQPQKNTDLGKSGKRKPSKGQPDKSKLSKSQRRRRARK